MKQPDPDHRYREKDGPIARKHGSVRIGTLRDIFGASFAPGIPDYIKLSDILHELDETSLEALVRDHAA